MRERETERERDMELLSTHSRAPWLSLVCALTRDRICTLGTLGRCSSPPSTQPELHLSLSPSEAGWVCQGLPLQVHIYVKSQSNGGAALCERHLPTPARDVRVLSTRKAVNGCCVAEGGTRVGALGLTVGGLWRAEPPCPSRARRVPSPSRSRRHSSHVSKGRRARGGRSPGPAS